jgi:hypothetical protein
MDRRKQLLVSLFISLWCFTSLLSSVSFSILEKDWFLKSCCEGFLEKPMRREFLLDVAMCFNQGSGVTADVEVVQLLNINRLAIRLAVTTSAFACLNFSMVFPAASTAASPALANLFTHNGSFGTPSLSHKASQKWLQLRESGS